MKRAAWFAVGFAVAYLVYKRRAELNNVLAELGGDEPSKATAEEAAVKADFDGPDGDGFLEPDKVGGCGCGGTCGGC